LSAIILLEIFKGFAHRMIALIVWGSDDPDSAGRG
jgi:hypothetical protein